jgi:hypothetical protein
MTTRLQIPEPLKQTLLYESGFACVVCQCRGAHIHHINENNRNNDLDNLVVLCQIHHDEAHTRHQLSQNLTPNRLREFKARWLDHIRSEREKKATLTGQREGLQEVLSLGMTWGYINHRRVIQLVDDKILKEVDQRVFDRCKTNKIVDDRGIIVKPPNRIPAGNYIRNTVYDWFDYGDDQALHVLYSDFVDKISRKVNPTHMTELNWRPSYIRQCLQPGNFLFFVKDQYFKRAREGRDNCEVRCLARKNKVFVEYVVNTQDMFGTSSIMVSFSGHRSAAALLQLKSIERAVNAWTLLCTPIALGVGFRP